MGNDKLIFFHVGLGKNASTFLQYRFFPYLKGVHYIQRTKYGRFHQIIQKSKADKFLVSNEFDKQLESESMKIAAIYPHAKIIIVLRRQDSWIASQYRRYIKNGFSLSFPEFINLDGEPSFWNKEDLFFYPKLEFLEKLFGSKPLVLFHHDLKDNPEDFLNKIALFIGVDYDMKSINLKPKHTSYSEKQLIVIRNASKYLFRQNLKSSKIYWIRKIQRHFRMFFRYLVLYFATLIPSKWLNSAPLISEEELQKIKVFYQDDWKKCLNYPEN